MVGKLKRSIRCHLKHGTRCPHIERHSLRRPRPKQAPRTGQRTVSGRHTAG